MWPSPGRLGALGALKKNPESAFLRRIIHRVRKTYRGRFSETNIQFFVSPFFFAHVFCPFASAVSKNIRVS